MVSHMMIRGNMSITGCIPYDWAYSARKGDDQETQLKLDNMMKILYMLKKLLEIGIVYLVNPIVMVPYYLTKNFYLDFSVKWNETSNAMLPTRVRFSLFSRLSVVANVLLKYISGGSVVINVLNEQEKGLLKIKKMNYGVKHEIIY
ncbi:hypothetical protein [Candidatus Coxiella mudrowiae]|uniref:Uncharacterized protein n=1 Tax=Candidatus Coxiella mudrowiae TaxID=2054173 RepID=A0ABM5UV19_9COXI|nr:hypothetical protein [Candidatus Coxiella mudrowiae]AKQ33787.1 hypothetical protein CleRT_11440 [Candidatus Coxiella mudrowiae]